MKRPEIIVLGSLNMDLVMDVDRIPVAGETVLGNGFTESPGGKGANQAVACARLGGKVAMIGRLGRDSFSGPLLKNLKSAGISTDYITITDTHTGVALIMVDEAGRNIISVSLGANGEVGSSDVSAASADLLSADALLFQNECPSEAVEHAARTASEKGVPVVYNPAPAVKVPDSLLGCCSVVVPNETEAQFYSGTRIEGRESLNTAAGYFLERGCRNVIITLGSRGVYFNDGVSEGVVEALKVKAIDTVAAGDVFTGAFTVSFSSGGTLKESIEFAVHAAAVSVTRKGAQSSIPDLQELTALYPELKHLSG
jgi:ribokinase